jgi:hypothetical protein
MSTYFPFLRGKQNELLALKLLASTIATRQTVVPIIEPINGNGTTQGSFEKYVEEGMPFVFVTNPKHGEYVGKGNDLYEEICVGGALAGYDNYIPALHINRGTRIQEVNNFKEKYNNSFTAVIYNAEPATAKVLEWCAEDDRIYHHIFLDGKVSSAFKENVPLTRQVLVRDNFVRQVRNADYPTEVEHFTDLNTATGNPDNVNWGDYSIVGDHYSDGGGAALAVAIHHIHKSESTGVLEISHFLSDQQATTANVNGKIIEAVQKLVSNLSGLLPNDTCACEIYKEMAASQNSRGLGYLKRLALMHHLETIMQND